MSLLPRLEGPITRGQDCVSPRRTRTSVDSYTDLTLQCQGGTGATCTCEGAPGRGGRGRYPAGWSERRRCLSTRSVAAAQVGSCSSSVPLLFGCGVGWATDPGAGFAGARDNEVTGSRPRQSKQRVVISHWDPIHPSMSLETILGSTRLGTP